MIRALLALLSLSTVLMVSGRPEAVVAPLAGAPADPIDAGRFVWHDLMTRDVAAAKRFYGELLGWRFEDTRRNDRPYVLAQSAGTPVAGIVDVSARPNAGPQWLSFLAVADMDGAVSAVQSDGGKVLFPPQTLPLARAAIVADAQGAPLGLAQLRRTVPNPEKPARGGFFWHEYLARDAARALDFYKRLAGYEATVSDSRLGVEYHLLRSARGRAGLFQLPPASDVLPNWLPYILVDDAAALAPRVTELGGRVLLAPAPERRNGSLLVIADPGGAPLALQKYPF